MPPWLLVSPGGELYRPRYAGDFPDTDRLAAQDREGDTRHSIGKRYGDKLEGASSRSASWLTAQRVGVELTVKQHGMRATTSSLCKFRLPIFEMRPSFGLPARRVLLGRQRLQGSCHENLALAKQKVRRTRLQSSGRSQAARQFCNAFPLRTRSVLRGNKIAGEREGKSEARAAQPTSRPTSGPRSKKFEKRKEGIRSARSPALRSGLAAASALRHWSSVFEVCTMRYGGKPIF